LPEFVELWVFSSGGSSHWPYAPMIKSGRARTWTCNYDAPLGYRSGEERLLRLFLVGKNGQALIRCYSDLNQILVAPDRGWIGLSASNFTDDMVKVGALPITLVSAPTGRGQG
jgi:hypothetical protein